MLIGESQILENLAEFEASGKERGGVNPWMVAGGLGLGVGGIALGTKLLKKKPKGPTPNPNINTSSSLSLYRNNSSQSRSQPRTTDPVPTDKEIEDLLTDYWGPEKYAEKKQEADAWAKSLIDNKLYTTIDITSKRL
jgi:hypothetical protein